MEVVCGRFKFSVYENEQNGYCVYQYRNVDSGKTFSAAGFNLPQTPGAIVVLHGDWENNPKYNSATLKVTFYEIQMPNAEDDTVQYLRSLHVGIGEATARRIWDKFGPKMWDVLREHPEEFKSIRGVSEQRLEKLIHTVAEQQTVHDLYVLLKNHIDGITMHKLKTIADALGPSAAEQISANPYILCQFRGMSFGSVDSLGQSMGFSHKFPDRLTAAIIYALHQLSAQGHTCYPKEGLEPLVLRLLNKGKHQGDDITAKDFEWALHFLEEDCNKRISVVGKRVFTINRLQQEKTIAHDLLRLSHQANPNETKEMAEQFNTFISSYSAQTGVQYAKAQLAAIRMALSNRLSVITGGPGTGKTTVIKAVIAAYQSLCETCEPLLLAPTGRAARRMHAQTGYEASTIHSALGLVSEDEDATGDGEGIIEYLDADLIIVDEVSMMDAYVASQFFHRIKTGTTVILVGDPDQLPSVGAGNILYEIIRSQVIPVTRLEIIFRQADTNPIIPNAAKIREGNTDLIIDGTKFRFYEANDPLQIVRKACKLYISAVRTRGIDNVVLLNPYRDKGDISAKIFNKNLQHYINPPKEGDDVFRMHDIEFRKGDKIMQMKNTKQVKNGDIGYIKDILMCPASEDSTDLVKCCKVEFDEQEYIYKKEDMKNVDLAYCCTVHKSQGSEYCVVIFVAAREHANLLRRNLIYTAITRASDTVAIVGERDALDFGIRDDTKQTRYTLLGDYLHHFAKNREKKGV